MSTLNKSSIDIHKVLIHFNIFKYLSMDINLGNLGYFEKKDNVFSYLNKIGDDIYSNTQFSEKLINDQLNDKGNIEKNVHFIYANDTKKIFNNKNIFFNIILFLTKSDGSLLKNLYYGLEFYDDYKEHDKINDYNKIHKVDTNLNTYYVLDNGYYPFFLINDIKDEIIPILELKNISDYKYNFYNTIDKLDTYQSNIDDSINVYYKFLVENHSDKKIKFKNNKIFLIKGNDFKKDDFVYNDIRDNKDFFIDLIYYSYLHDINYNNSYDISKIMEQLKHLHNNFTNNNDIKYIYESIFTKLLE